MRIARTTPDRLTLTSGPRALGIVLIRPPLARVRFSGGSAACVAGALNRRLSRN